MQSTFLGIDFGTSAVRACLIDEQENLLGLTSCPLTTVEEGPHRYQLPEEWLSALETCLAELFETHAPGHIQAIAVDGTSGTVLLCDPGGKPRTAALMYHDASSTDETTWLRDLHPLPEVAISATAGLPKLLQLAGRVDQPVVAQHQADWITGWLCGRYGHTDENSALKTGYDARQRCWPDWVRRIVPKHVTLPDIMIPGSPLGKAARALVDIGISPETTIVAGTTDSTAAFLATCAHGFHQGVTTLGSTLVIKQLSPRPVEDVATGVYSHRLGDAWLTGGASNSGGCVLDQYFSRQEIDTLSRQIDPHTQSGLNYYPLTATGERFPINNPAKSPMLEPRPDRDADFLKGIMEGIARIEKAGYERLNQSGTPPVREIISTGGGAVNPVWQAIRERILGIPIIRARETESAYGAARLAKNGTEIWDGFNSQGSIE